MEKKKIFQFVGIFLLGFFFANLLSSYSSVESPFSVGLKIFNDAKSPSDFITRDQIEVYDDKIIISVKGATIGRYSPTKSMEPVLNEDSNGIRIVPESSEDIEVGDIITFRQDGYLIIHRVIEKGLDENGVYFITQGDNSNFSDEKVRFEDIEYITIGILY